MSYCPFRANKYNSLEDKEHRSGQTAAGPEVIELQFRPHVEHSKRDETVRVMTSWMIFSWARLNRP